MPNKRYLRGRKFEWEIRNKLRAEGYEVVRAAGSKSKLDITAFHKDLPNVLPLAIQAKTIRSGTYADIRRCRNANPPALPKSDHYRHELWIKCKGKVHIFPYYG